ncbi:MAG: bifunctional (p)ppGpp synthetase/guanosine-3',5'-bis(diphosphate) 3'-pyrophosphohydrolase [Actinomycetota bacterium]|nr:bifunctional (p)ppGpp synthetase/guanosine-3',5'-bis(diphosphate) 3'-pyrophosphohydrolase [Actinomycetota bacterium]
MNPKVNNRAKNLNTDIIYKKLIKKIKSYNPGVDEKLIHKAYQTSKEYHKNQYRKSGEPFIVHPLEVALILAEIELDQISIASAILHDVIEDTEYSLEMAKKEFGNKIANIINGVTKLDKIVFDSKEERQVNNIRKMIIAMSEDVRIILVKLADRLHNMRTLDSLGREKRKINAMETLEVYAPIAHRLGIYYIKSELEDLSFKYLHPKEYKKIKDMFDEKLEERKLLIDEAIKIVNKKLKQMKISADINGRIKTYYSVYNKIVKQNRKFEDIYDIIAIRIIVNDIKNCYAVLGSIHSLWKPVPGRFKDFIANPKFNMYQSLHTTVISLKGKPLEIQIRTFEMHKFAEYGIAAHYKYKEGGLKKVSEFDKRIAWIRQILDWQKELKDPQDYMESLKLDLFEEEVFVFTPKGKVINLPRGATTIDFAYQIHTDVGHNIIGAKINGNMVPIESVLENGDIVEIIVAKNKKGPSRDWLNIVKTSRARNKIKQWFSKEHRQETYNAGRDIMLKVLRKNSLSFKSVPMEIFNEVAGEMNFDKVENLFRGIGSHKVSAHQVFTRIVKKLNQQEPKKELTIEDIHRKEPGKEEGPGIKVKGMGEVLVTIAKCCNPVPGDKIVGYITRGKGVSVHRADCSNIKNLMNKEKQRFIDVEWDEKAPRKFNAEIQIEALDRTKLLRDITKVISEYDLNIARANSLKVNKSGYIKFRFVIEINDKYILKDVINNIKQVDSVYDAFRVLPGK